MPHQRPRICDCVPLVRAHVAGTSDGQGCDTGRWLASLSGNCCTLSFIFMNQCCIATMEKKSFSTSIKFGKYRTFLKNLTEEQKVVVRSCGFDNLLHFDCKEAPRSVAYLLAKSFDVATRTVKLQNGSSFELNAFVVHQILGVPLGGRRI